MLYPSDQVLIRNNAHDKNHTNKFSFKWTGPYKIDRCVSRVIYKLKDMDGSIVEGIFHKDRLKKYYAREGSLSDS